MERNDNRFVPHLQRTRIFRTLFILINLIFVLPAGFIMCVGPLFSPFAGMPLAEEVCTDPPFKLYIADADT